MEDESNVLINKLIKGTGLFIIFGIYSYVIAFLFKLVVARHYGASDFGLFTLVQTILGIIVLIAGLGIVNSIPRYIPYYKEKKDFAALTGYKSFIFRTPLALSLILSIILFIFAEHFTLFFGFPTRFIYFLRIISLILPLKLVTSVIKKIFIAENKPIHTLISYHFLEYTSLFIISSIFVLLDLSIIFIVIALALSTIISFFYSIIVYNLEIKLPSSRRKKFFVNEWLAFSIPLFLTGIFTYFISWSDNIIIGKVLDPAELGVYSIVYSLAIFIAFFQTSFSSIFLPLISRSYARKDHHNIDMLFKRSAAWIFGMTFPFFLVIILFSKQILRILFGKEYVSGYLALIIISVGVLINISTGLCREILIMQKRTKSIFFVNMTIVSANIILNIIFIPIWGIIGAAVTSAASIALQNLLFLWIASRTQKIGFDWIYNLKFIIAGIPSVFAALFIFRSININVFLAIFIAAVIYISLYVIILLLIKTPTKEDIRIILMIEKKLGINLEFIKKPLRKIYS